MNLPVPTDERVLAYAYKAFSEGMAGRDFDRLLTEMVNGALKAIEDCTDYRESTDLVMRYQQRKAVAEVIRNYIQGLIESLGGDNLDGNDTNPESDNFAYSGSGPDPARE